MNKLILIKCQKLIRNCKRCEKRLIIAHPQYKRNKNCRYIITITN